MNETNEPLNRPEPNQGPVDFGGFEIPGVNRLADDVYWKRDSDPKDDVLESILVWHWCERSGRWKCTHVGQHTLVSLEPLHLEPSLLWYCCGKHGFIREGRWIPA